MSLIEDIRPDLVRWVTLHPEWKPEEDFLDVSYRDVAIFECSQQSHTSERLIARGGSVTVGPSEP